LYYINIKSFIQRWTIKRYSLLKQSYWGDHLLYNLFGFIIIF
jgi:hypothetical protein